MISEKLKLDKRDDIIVQMLSKDPNVSQEEIAKKLKLSQPSVWARIRNLKERGVINTIVGMDFKTVDLYLAKVDISSTDTQAIIDEFKDCPYFLNALITSGKYNLCILFVGTDLKNIEGLVNHHLRNNKLVNEIEMNIVISTARNLVLPLNIDYDNKIKCNQDCKHCIG